MHSSTFQQLQIVPIYTLKVHSLYSYASKNTYCSQGFADVLFTYITIY